jgi:hypothetical protein
MVKHSIIDVSPFNHRTFHCIVPDSTRFSDIRQGVVAVDKENFSDSIISAPTLAEVE